MKNGILVSGVSCFGHDSVKECTEQGGKCETGLDGYYIEVLVCTVLGIVWLYYCRRLLQQLQDKDESAWRIRKDTTIAAL